MGYGILLLVVICSLSKAQSLQCFDSSYQRRYGFDNYYFSDTTLFDDPVDSRAECVSRCQWNTACNQAIYHEVTNTCKLYSDSSSSLTGAVSASGWQFYAASCDIYRPNNSVASTHVLKENADDVCDVYYHALITCTPTSCYNRGTWTSFAVRCTPTLFSYPPTTLNPALDDTVTVPFDLEPGHVISLRLSGSLTQNNEINMMASNGDYPFHLSVRFHLSFPQCAFNIKESSTYGTEQTKFYLMNFITSGSDYKIDIHIMSTEFKIYGDGHLLLTSSMRLPFTGIRKLVFLGIEQLRKVKIGPDVCPY